MPGLSGRQVAEQLAARQAGLRVLYISGYTDDVIARRGVLEPGTAFLAKPFTPDSLAAKVSDLLNG
jgi:FixJ family two-component response regulator